MMFLFIEFCVVVWRIWKLILIELFFVIIWCGLVFCFFGFIVCCKFIFWIGKVKLLFLFLVFWFWYFFGILEMDLVILNNIVSGCYLYCFSLFYFLWWFVFFICWGGFLMINFFIIIVFEILLWREFLMVFLIIFVFFFM